MESEGEEEYNKGEMVKVEKWRKEDLTDKIINACINVHRELGPGFLESIYHNALKIEFERQNLQYESEKEVKVKYLDAEVGNHRLDLFVEEEIIVELKTVEDLILPALRAGRMRRLSQVPLPCAPLRENQGHETNPPGGMAQPPQ